MKSLSPLPQHLSRDISQLGLALRDCARQIRYVARNVPGPVKRDKPATTRSPATQSVNPPGQLFLDSVAHFADDLIETAETFAGHAVPPLQDHWKSPVPLEPLTSYLALSGSSAKSLRLFSTGYYAAAKRMIMRCGAADVLIFEHLISRALESVNAGLTVAQAMPEGDAVGESFSSRHMLCQTCAQLVLSLIEMQPVRSTRFDVLPDANAPWWLITEPNTYVFLTLSIASLAKDLYPDDLATEPDAVIRFFADVVGARETAFRKAFKERDPLGALTIEIEHVTAHLC